MMTLLALHGRTILSQPPGAVTCGGPFGNQRIPTPFARASLDREYTAPIYKSLFNNGKEVV
jgi:hypothetical protein